MAEAPGRHGLSEPLRTAVYAWFDRWLFGRTDPPPSSEIPVKPRPDAELLVCPDGQANLSLRSRPFLPMAWEHFDRKPRPARSSLEELLRLDPEHADPRIDELATGRTDAAAVYDAAAAEYARNDRRAIASRHWMLVKSNLTTTCSLLQI